MFALITMLALARADDAGRVPRARESRWSPGRRSADAEDAPHIRKTQVRYAGERRRATAASDDAAPKEWCTVEALQVQHDSNACHAAKLLAEGLRLRVRIAHNRDQHG